MTQKSPRALFSMIDPFALLGVRTDAPLFFVLRRYYILYFPLCQGIFLLSSGIFRYIFVFPCPHYARRQFKQKGGEHRMKNRNNKDQNQQNAERSNEQNQNQNQDRNAQNKNNR